jgi:hypothetical protein
MGFQKKNHLNCVKMVAFHPGKQRKVGWVGDDSHVFGKNSMVKKDE